MVACFKNTGRIDFEFKFCRTKVRLSTNFPRPLPIQNKWKRFCGLAEDESIARKRVCSDHFHRNDYHKRMNNSIQMKNSTINPSLNLPDQV